MLSKGSSNSSSGPAGVVPAATPLPQMNTGQGSADSAPSSEESALQEIHDSAAAVRSLMALAADGDDCELLFRNYVDEVC